MSPDENPPQVLAVRVREDDGEWWLNAADLAAYFRDVSNQGLQIAMESEDEATGFGTYATSMAIARFADALDVTLIEASTTFSDSTTHGQQPERNTSA